MRAKCCPPKCMRAGRVTNNGYLNFLREFRRKCCGMSPIETVRNGAKAWCKLSKREKCRYKNMRPTCTPPRRKKNPCRCMRKGPMTRNGFLNFMRQYRRNHCGLSPQKTLCQGAEAWKCLAESTKRRYARMVGEVFLVIIFP